MQFEKDKFKNNITFFAVVTLVVIILFLFSFFIRTDALRLEEKELTNDDSSVKKLIINEIMTSNKGVYPDSNGNFYDYIELYNGSSKEINLLNYGLSDEANTIKWTFPEVKIGSKEYLIVYLSGTNDNGLYAPFKLKSSGEETLGLRSQNGKTIDAVETIGLKSNTVMARDKDGNWIIQNEPTPGYANTIDGHNAFLGSLVEKQNDLVINEILPNNKGSFKDSLNLYSGYIEIVNNGKETINLENYSLSNSETVNFRWQFPKMKIKPGEVVVVYTSNKNLIDPELHSSFKLDNENGVVVLGNNKGKVIDKVTYTGVENGMAYIREKNGFNVGNNISPGYSNNVNGIKNFQKEALQNIEDLIINEVMNSNYSHLAQNGGKFYDWVELKNNSKKTIKLNEYFITTSTNDLEKYNLPDIELKPGELYILIASGEESLSNNSYKHSNFKLSKTESLYIVKDRKIVDALFMANIPTGYSMGRGEKFGVYYFSKPTPKEKNSSGTEVISYAPTSNVESGVYNDTKSLSLELSGEGTIYYTLDGSAPSTSSKVYNSPISLTKTTIIRYISAESGKLKSPVISQSFILNENHTLPVISVSTAPSDLNSLQRNAWNEGYEVAGYAHYFEEGKEGFEIPCAFQLFGGSTRGHDKKSFELVFKKKFGAGSLSYQVFENRDTASYESIVLRTGSQDDQESDSKSGTLLRDTVVTTLIEEYTSVDVQAYKAVILYINGRYWGIYFMREKIDDNFVSNHYNVDKRKTDLLRIDGQVKSGTSKNYNNLLSFIRNNPLSISANYNKVKEMVDIENIIDFWIAETWTANNDIVNVRFFSNPDLDGGRWKFIAYDFDYGMYNINKNYYEFSTSTSGMTVNGYSTELLRNLMKSKEFKKTYLERLSYNLKNTWNPDNVVARIDELAAEIRPEIKRNSQRWNRSYTNWESQLKYLKKFAKERNAYMKSFAKSFFGLSDSEMKKYFEGVK